MLRKLQSFRHINAAFVARTIVVNTCHIVFLPLDLSPDLGNGCCMVCCFTCFRAAIFALHPSLLCQYSVHPVYPSTILDASSNYPKFTSVHHLSIYSYSIQLASNHPSIFRQPSIHPPAILNINPLSILYPVILHPSSVHPLSVLNIHSQYIVPTLGSTVLGFDPRLGNLLIGSAKDLLAGQFGYRLNIHQIKTRWFQVWNLNSKYYLL